MSERFTVDVRLTRFAKRSAACVVMCHLKSFAMVYDTTATIPFAQLSSVRIIEQQTLHTVADARKCVYELDTTLRQAQLQCCFAGYRWTNDHVYDLVRQINVYVTTK